jgi:hypothetical protein
MQAFMNPLMLEKLYSKLRVLHELMDKKKDFEED